MMKPLVPDSRSLQSYVNAANHVGRQDLWSPNHARILAAALNHALLVMSTHSKLWHPSFPAVFDGKEVKR